MSMYIMTQMHKKSYWIQYPKPNRKSIEWSLLAKKLRENNLREVWDGMKTITGCKEADSIVEGDELKANQLNLFYKRFDCPPSAASACHSHSYPYLSTPCPSSLSPPPPAAASPLPHAATTDSVAPLNPATTNQPPPVDAPAPRGSSKDSESPLPPIMTADQVRAELRRIRTRKACGPDKVCPRLLKACAVELGEPLQHVFNLSLRQGKVPALWKTSCLIPVPKKPHPRELNDFRPIALTSHIMKTMERLLPLLLRPQIRHALMPPPFACQEIVGVEDAVTYLLHRAHSHLDIGDMCCENHVL